MSISYPTPAFAVRLDAPARVRAFVSKEETHYYLNGIHIEPSSDGGVICVATDGHRMGIRHSRDGLCLIPATFKLPPEIKLPGKLVTAPWLVGIATAEGRGHISVVSAIAPKADDTAEAAMARVDDCMIRIGQAFVGGKFLDFRRVVPDVGDKAVTRSFNGSYVKDFGNLVTLTGADETSAHLIHVAGDPEFIGILMPVAHTVAAKVPAWLEEPKVEPRKKAA